MIITIPHPISETPDHYTIAAGEWEATEKTLVIGHRQPRQVPGYTLRRGTDQGWPLIDIPAECFDAYVTEGKIIVNDKENKK